MTYLILAALLAVPAPANFPHLPHLAGMARTQGGTLFRVTQRGENFVIEEGSSIGFGSVTESGDVKIRWKFCDCWSTGYYQFKGGRLVGQYFYDSLPLKGYEEEIEIGIDESDCDP